MLDYKNVNYVEGFIDSIVFRNEDNGYTVFDIKYKGEHITCVGTISYINAGEFITANGEFVQHAIYDMQFSIKSYEFKTPDDERSIRRYLSSGAIKGIGEKMAERIVNTFKEDTFRIMEQEPERLAEIKGISLNKAMDIDAQLVDKRDMRKAMIFLQDYGINMNLANKIYSHYGQNIYTIIKQNPYKLADDISGIGFKIADDIAVKVGIRVDSDFRIKSGILYVLQQASLQGHIYLPLQELESGVKSLLLIDIPDIEKFITDLAIDKKIVVKNDENENRNVYSAIYYYMELSVAKMLADLEVHTQEDEKYFSEKIADIEDETKIKLDDIQKKAVKTAVENGLMVITGGPGTGKTTTINTIIKYFEKEGYEIRLAAPTGRAAKRMTETSGYEAQTIHRMLEISGAISEDSDKISTGIHFERDESNPLEADVIIVDEMSMVDINIMNSLLKAVAIGTKLILVGDVDQLPSVGPGNVLKDIINSDCIPVVKLERIFRQAAESEIVTNAHKINKGEKVVLNKYSKDFLFVRRNSADAIIGAICTLIKSKLPDYVKADINEIQILTPSRKSAVGVERLNRIMQEYLNPQDATKMEKVFADTIFREGDKVMQIKNNYQMEWEKKSKYGVTYESGAGIYNGDTGVIVEINTFAERVIVKFEDEKYVSYEFKQLDELELAYAITIHKSQGSEYPAVIIPMFTGPRMLMTKNLLYTAVTRAKKCVCMVGIEDYFHQMADNNSEQKRYSSLDIRIKQILSQNIYQ